MRINGYVKGFKFQTQLLWCTIDSSTTDTFLLFFIFEILFQYSEIFIKKEVYPNSIKIAYIRNSYFKKAYATT